MVKGKKYFLSLVLICFGQTGFFAQNQNHTIDSLLAVLKTAKDDTAKAKTLNFLSREYINSGRNEEGMKYANDALNLSNLILNSPGKENSIISRVAKREIARAYHNIAILNYNKSNYPEALKYHNMAFSIRVEIADRVSIGDSYISIGNVYYALSNYPEALKNYIAAQKIYEETGSKIDIARAHHNIGLIYHNQGNDPEALKSYLSALKIYEETGSKKSIATAQYNIGRIYHDQGNYPEALKNFLASLKVSEEIRDKRGMANAHRSIGLIYLFQENYPESLKHYLAALKISEEIGDKSGISYAYNSIGLYYQYIDNKQEALKNYLAGLKIQEEIGDKYGMTDSYFSIGSIYYFQNNYPEALKNYFAGLKIKEETGNMIGIGRPYINIGGIFIKQAALETGTAAKLKYNEAIQYINKGLLIAKEAESKEDIKDAYYFFAEFYESMNDYKKALEYNNLYVALKDSLQNNETTHKLEKLRTEYEVEKSVEEEKIKSEAALAKQKANLKRKNELLLAGFALLAIIATFITLLSRQRNQKRRAIEKAEAGHKMAELELQSLRAQLNPHFMFNSLNAIQDLILKEDNDRSHLYLSRFSKLLRMLLDDANQPFVTVKQEIEFLELYLSLENLRIPDLKFSIEKDPKINAEERMVPNMMLQPYIENAIWHGLSNKKGERKLQIRIHENGTATEFEIEDNGIGRKKADEIKAQFRKGHHSKGMELLSKRFTLLSKEYGADIQTTVTDLGNNGDVTGTLVKIDVPFSLSEQANQLLHDTNHHN